MSTMRKRIRPTWAPVWTPEIEAWTAKTIRINQWRFDRIDTFRDVMQEAKLLFYTLWRKYPIVKEMRHFCALYRTSIHRMFTDKARLRQKSPEVVATNTEEMAEALHLSSHLPNNGYLNLLLEEMPDELKTVLGALTTGRIRLRLDKSTTSIRPRENDNMRLKRRFSLSAVDPVGDLRGYFAS